MANETTSTEVLRLAFEVDRQSAQQADQAAKTLGQQIAQSARQSNESTRALSQSIKDQVQAVRDATAAEREWARAREGTVRVTQQQSKALYDELDALRKNASASSGSGGSTGGGSGLSRGLSSVAAVLPGSAGQGVQGIAEIARLTERLPRLGQSLGLVEGAEAGAVEGTAAFGAALGPIAIVAGGAAIAVAAYNEAVDKGNAYLDAAIKANVDYYRLIGTKSTPELKEGAKQLAAELTALKQARAGFNTADLDRVSQIPLIGNALVGLIPGFGELAKQGQELDKQITSTDLELNAYNNALNSQEVAARDAAAATKDMATATAKGAEATRLLLGDRSASSAALQQSALASERSLIAARNQYNADELVAAKKYGDDRAAIIQDTNDKIAAIDATLVRDIERADAQAAAKLEADKAQVREEAATRDEKEAADSAAQINKIEADYALRRKQILETYSDSELTAEQNRDAVALDGAKRTRDKDLRDAKSDRDRGIAQEQAALKTRLDMEHKADAQRLTDLQAAYETEKQQRDAALELRAADERTAATEARDKALEQLRIRYTAEEQARSDHYKQELGSLDSHLLNLQNLTDTALDKIVQSWIDHYTQLASQTTGADTGTVPNPSGNPGPALAGGARNWRGGWVKIGPQDGEAAWLPQRTNVYSAQQTRMLERLMQTGGGRSVTLSDRAVVINTQSSDPQGIMREVERQLPDMLAHAIEKATEL